MSGPRRALRSFMALAPAVATIAVLYGGALAGAIRTSLEPLGGLGGPVTLAAWRSVLADPEFTDALRFTGEVTAAATFLSAAAAVGCAAVLRHRGPLARGAFGLPVVVPHLVVAVLAVVWLGPGGLADRLLGGLPVQVIRDRAGLGIVLVYLVKETPFLTLLVLAAWGRGVAEREEVAMVAGARWSQRLRWVVWPEIRAPLALGSLIVAAFTLGSFEVPLVVGPSYPPTVATYALHATRTASLAGRSQAAAALLVAAAVSLVLALLVVRRARSFRA